MKKSNIVYVEGYFARTDEEPVNRVAVLQQEKYELENEKCELLGLIQGKDEAIKELKEREREHLNQIENLAMEIKELKEQCSILADCNTCTSVCKKENDKLKNEVAELKAQIEKMKCCENCVHRDDRDLFPTVDEAEHIPCDDCKRLEGRILSDVLTTDNWKLREIEE